MRALVIFGRKEMKSSGMGATAEARPLLRASMCRHVSDGSRAIGPLRRGIFVNKIREKGLRRPLRDGARLFHRGSKRNVLTLRPRVLVLPILPQKPSPRPLSYLAQRPAPSAPPRVSFSRDAALSSAFALPSVTSRGRGGGDSWESSWQVSFRKVGGSCCWCRA